MTSRQLGYALGIFPVLVTASAAAEQKALARFHTDAKVVLINATVLDRQNRPVRGLERDRFRLFEDKTEQTIAYFGEEEIPLSLAVVFDMSSSMESKIPGTRRALAAVLDTRNPADEFSLITFSDRPRLAIPWTDEAGNLQDQILFTRPHGRTSLLDAIHLALTRMRQARNPRRAVVVFSDGGDNSSRFTERRLSRLLEEADMQLYAVDMTEPPLMRQRTPEEIAGPGLLARLCDRGSGRYFQVTSDKELGKAADQISKELRSQYVLGYVPPSGQEDGRFRHVQLKLLRAAGEQKLSVYWRRGYRTRAE